MRVRCRRLLFVARGLPRAWRLWRDYRRDPLVFLPAELARNRRLSLLDFQTVFLDSWYHDFEKLGFKTGKLHPNQASKQQVLFPMIGRAVELCREPGAPPSGVELFCADGYYSNYAVQIGAGPMVAIDRDGTSIRKARLITAILGNCDAITFRRGDVFDLSGGYRFGICAGGLYHIEDPGALLRPAR